MGKTILDENWNEEAFLQAAPEFQLVYIFADKPFEFQDPRFHWVDTKVTFEKTLHHHEAQSEIQIYTGDFCQKLEDLSLISGSYSRFRTDSRLQNHEFDKLYHLWIRKAWESNRVLAAPELIGMVTFQTEGEQGAIGLIAVDENHQNQGWGRKLIKAAEAEVLHQGAKSMRIPTQSTNLSACRFYSSLGYNRMEERHIYHFWKT